MVFLSQLNGTNSINKIPNYAQQYKKECLNIKEYNNLTLTNKLKKYIEEIIKMEKYCL